MVVGNDHSDPSLEIDAQLDKTAELGDGKTSIDLAEDLLGRTRTVTLSAGMLESMLESDDAKARKQSETPHECVETAKILFNEGLIDEAKRFCRRALILDPGFTPAIQYLKNIHDKELEKLLDFDSESSHSGTDITRDTYGSRKTKRGQTGEIESATVVLERLDRDLKLGLFQETSLYKEFFLKQSDLERCLDDISPRDRLDMIVALMSMELWDHALVQLQTLQKEAAQGLADEGLLRSALGLTAEAYLQIKKPYDAITVIQPVLRDIEISDVEKLSFYYLMARAHEDLKQDDVARQWYGHILQTDENYRDAFDRHRKLRPRQ